MKMPNLVKGLFLTAVAAAATAPAAQAFPQPGVPITTNPGPLIASVVFPTTVVYAYANAGDKNQLFLSPNPATIFDNKVDSPGKTADLGILSGPQVFGLRDLSVVKHFPGEPARQERRLPCVLCPGLQQCCHLQRLLPQLLRGSP